MEDGSPDELESVVDGLVDAATQAGLSEAFVEVSAQLYIQGRDPSPPFPHSESALLAPACGNSTALSCVS